MAFLRAALIALVLMLIWTAVRVLPHLVALPVHA